MPKHRQRWPLCGRARWPGRGLTVDPGPPTGLHWAPEQMVIIENQPSLFSGIWHFIAAAGCQACFPPFAELEKPQLLGCNTASFHQRLLLTLSLSFSLILFFSFGKPDSMVHQLFSAASCFQGARCSSVNCWGAWAWSLHPRICDVYLVGKGHVPAAP